MKIERKCSRCPQVVWTDDDSSEGEFDVIIVEALHWTKDPWLCSVCAKGTTP